MTYRTPELLLVGAAQSLVLTGQDNSIPYECEISDAEPGSSDSVELW